MNLAIQFGKTFHSWLPSVSDTGEDKEKKDASDGDSKLLNCSM